MDLLRIFSFLPLQANIVACSFLDIFILEESSYIEYNCNTMHVTVCLLQLLCVRHYKANILLLRYK